MHTSFKTACQLTLRQKISCTPIPRAAFSLMFKGKFLEPRVPLEHYGIQDGCIIEAMMKGIGGNGTDQHKSVCYHFLLDIHIIFDFYVCRMKCYQNVYHVVKEQTYTVMNVKHPGVNYVMISGIDIPKEGNIK